MHLCLILLAMSGGVLLGQSKIWFIRHCDKELRPKEFRPKELQPKELKSKELKSKEFQPKEFQPKELQPKELRPKELQPKELKAKDLDNPTRHLRTTNTSTTDCCSDIGYSRNEGWARFFLYETEFPQIYASNYNHNNNQMCMPIPDDIITHKKTCQKSQRMVLTAATIHQTMHLTAPINTDYCIGEAPALIREIHKSKSKNIIVVWEHNEIVEMIRYLGFRIPQWPHQLRNVYNIMFLYENDRLHYGCYDYLNNTITDCDWRVSRWLTDIPRLTNKTQSINMFHYIGVLAIATMLVFSIIYSCIASTLYVPRRKYYLRTILPYIYVSSIQREHNKWVSERNARNTHTHEYMEIK